MLKSLSANRRNLELKNRRDEGEPRELLCTDHADSAAYSELVQVNKKELGCCYVHMKFSMVDTICFLLFLMSNI